MVSTGQTILISFRYGLGQFIVRSLPENEEAQQVGTSNGGQRPCLNSGFPIRRGWPIRSLMKSKRKKAISVFAAIIVLLAFGWVTSTRHVEMKFLEDGVPIANCELHFMIIGSDGRENKPLKIDRNGDVRMPNAFAGKRAIYAIKRGDELLQSIYEPEFERGFTVVNFVGSGIESTHRYRFLFYDSTTTSRSMNLSNDKANKSEMATPSKPSD
jgi:hypothetical protein